MEKDTFDSIDVTWEDVSAPKSSSIKETEIEDAEWEDVTTTESAPASEPEKTEPDNDVTTTESAPASEPEKTESTEQVPPPSKYTLRTSALNTLMQTNDLSDLQHGDAKTPVNVMVAEVYQHFQEKYLSENATPEAKQELSDATNRKGATLVDVGGQKIPVRLMFEEAERALSNKETVGDFSFTKSDLKRIKPAYNAIWRYTALEAKDPQEAEFHNEALRICKQLEQDQANGAQVSEMTAELYKAFPETRNMDLRIKIPVASPNPETGKMEIHHTNEDLMKYALIMAKAKAKGGFQFDHLPEITEEMTSQVKISQPNTNLLSAEERTQEALNYMMNKTVDYSLPEFMRFKSEKRPEGTLAYTEKDKGSVSYNAELKATESYLALSDEDKAKTQLAMLLYEKLPPEHVDKWIRTMGSHVSNVDNNKETLSVDKQLGKIKDRIVYEKNGKMTSADVDMSILSILKKYIEQTPQEITPDEVVLGENNQNLPATKQEIQDVQFEEAKTEEIVPVTNDAIEAEYEDLQPAELADEQTKEVQTNTEEPPAVSKEEHDIVVPPPANTVTLDNDAKEPDGKVSFENENVPDGKVNLSDIPLVKESFKDPTITPRKWDSFAKEALLPEMKDLIAPLKNAKTVEDAAVDLMLKLLIVQITFPTRIVSYYAQQVKKDRLNIQKQEDEYLKGKIAETTPDKVAKSIKMAFEAAAKENQINPDRIPKSPQALMGMMQTLGHEDDMLLPEQLALKKEMQKCLQVESLPSSLMADDREAGKFARMVCREYGLEIDSKRNFHNYDGRMGVLRKKQDEYKVALQKHRYNAKRLVVPVPQHQAPQVARLPQTNTAIR